MKYVKDKGGNKEDGKDIFHDAIIKLDERVRDGAIEHPDKIGSYLQGIARNLWLRRLSNSKREELKETISTTNEVASSPEEDFISKERIDGIEQILDKIGASCKQILTMYKLSYSMVEIAETLNFANAKVAKNEAYRCRKKFRDFVYENPAYLDLLN